MILDSATQIPRPEKASVYRMSVPYRWVIHSVECPPDADLTSVATTHAHPPQFWASMGRRQIIQSIDTNLAAQALAHPAGSVETNHARAIQVEVAGYAADMHHYPAEWFEWLGRELIGPIAAHHGIDLTHYPTFPTYPGSYGNNGVRFTDVHWLNFGGVCGHMHVPGNDHGDPGAVPIQIITAAAGEDDMYTDTDRQRDNKAAVDAAAARAAAEKAQKDAAKALKIVQGQIGGKDAVSIKGQVNAIWERTKP